MIGKLGLVPKNLSRSGARPLIFVKRNRGSRFFASEIMRTEELAHIVKRFGGWSAGVRVMEIDSTLDTRDSVLWLNKRVIEQVSATYLEELRARKNLLVSDYIDGPSRTDIDHFFDLHVASSVSQFQSFMLSHGPSKVWFVTHHVSNFPAFTNKFSNDFRIAYFGEPSNAPHLGKLSKHVDVFSTQNGESFGQVNNSWPAHYIFRFTRAGEGFKPYTKGFFAAHAGSVVLDAGDNEEARWYLGCDYPFLAKSSQYEDVVNTIEFAKSEYGSPVWEHALEVMRSVRERSAERQVYREIIGLMNLLGESN